MGIKKDDIKKITVAGVDCIHQEDRYSVSTRYSNRSDGLVNMQIEAHLLLLHIKLKLFHMHL